jgi:O-antigen ligase
MCGVILNSIVRRNLVQLRGHTESSLLICTAQLVSLGLVSLIPLTLVLYRIIFASQPTLAASVCRPAILLVCCALAMFWYGSHVSSVEHKLIRVVAVLCGALLVTSLLATNPERALQEWIKLALMCVIAIALCRPLVHPPNAMVLGASLVLAGAVFGILIVVIYVKYMSWALPSYPATRVFKAVAMDEGGVPLNPLGFECVFTFLCGACLLRRTKLLWVVGLALVLISSALTGSRAPISVFVLSAVVLLLLTGFRSRDKLLRVASVLGALAILAGGVIAISSATSLQLAEVTEGRWYVWSVALHKFTVHPLWGNGYLSVEDDPTYLSGGYHNEYLTALAEQGIIGFCAVMYLFGFLLSCSWKLAFDPSCRNANGKIVLFACLFLLFRAVVELPGLFGTAQGPADFLAYVFLAIAVSQVARSERSGRATLNIPC